MIHYYNRLWFVVAPLCAWQMLFVFCVYGAEPESESIRVMSFNLWHGGDAGGQPLEQSAQVIRASKADVVGLQETEGTAPEGQPRPDNAAKLAKLLGWQYLSQGGRTGIISRFKIVGGTEQKWGAKLVMPSGRQFYLFNTHFSSAPYQPYQLLRIPYHDAPFISTEAEAIEAARNARGGEVDRLLAEVRSVFSESLPIFITGDFNEPSHHDWTKEVALAKKCLLPVQWPTTATVEKIGFVDAYREVRPDALRDPGLTWTPTTQASDPEDRHDRIDFVFAGGGAVRIKDAMVIGESAETADVVVTPYPSDHRAVCIEAALGPEH